MTYSCNFLVICLLSWRLPIYSLYLFNIYICSSNFNAFYLCISRWFCSTASMFSMFILIPLIFSLANKFSFSFNSKLFCIIFLFSFSYTFKFYIMSVKLVRSWFMLSFWSSIYFDMRSRRDATFRSTSLLYYMRMSRILNF